MALVKATLEAAILAAFTKQANKTGENDDPEQSRQELAADIATAVDAYIRTATVLGSATGVLNGTAVAPVTGTLI